MLCERSAMPSTVWGPEIADIYDSADGVFDPTVVGATVDVLVDLARGGPALEFAAGTGRIALPLAARGLPVAGIELSPHMAEKLQAKPGADSVRLTIGDMTTARVEGTFTLVYLLFNTIMNVTTQDEQVSTFENAARHLERGGLFLVEVLPPSTCSSTSPQVFALDENHIGIDTLDDPVGQISSSHHWWTVEGRLVHSVGTFRYVYPSELDLMARIAGLRAKTRWGDWDGSPYTATSTNLIAVYEKAS
jgi:ubiquinone/menaquinone biosynthesis C-methylase UbiE